MCVCVCVCVEGREGYDVFTTVYMCKQLQNSSSTTLSYQKLTSLTFQVGGVGHNCNLDRLPCHTVVPHSGHAQMVLDVTRSLGGGRGEGGGRRGVEGEMGHK